MTKDCASNPKNKMFLDYNPTQGIVADQRAYRTLQPLAPLNHWVQSYWTLTVPKGKFHYHSVPDNCVDWIINLQCFEDNFLVPPFLSPTLFQIDGPASFIGIRFRILGHRGLISVPLGDWSEEGSVKAEDLIHSDILNSMYDVIYNAKSFANCCNDVSALLLSCITISEVDSRLVRYVQYCHKNLSSNLDLSDSRISEFGLSARHLRRLTKHYLGLRPKDFGKVLRFQSVLKMISISRHSHDYLDHYYDQPHFVREFKRLSGVTPNQFRKMSVLYNHI